jgi:hypothetical protein
MTGNFLARLLCQLGLACGAESWWAPWLLPETHPIPNLPILAKAKEVSGTVLLKRFNDSNWLKLPSQEGLYLGDSLQTLSNSKIKIEYLGSGATLSMNENSYFKLESTTPEYSRFKQKSGLSNAKLKGALGDSSLSTAAQQDTRPGGGLKSEVFGMSLQKNISPIEVTEPIGDLIIVSSKSPVYLTFRADVGSAPGTYMAFLWQLSPKKAAPIWVGNSGGYFAAVPLKGPGVYILQMFSEDETRYSKPIKIRVSQKTSDWLSSLPELNLKLPIALEIR